tara:strand:+ start:408 stop:515 length:108 start_codon:yes stop_codon:yes gene_type:complete
MDKKTKEILNSDNDNWSVLEKLGIIKKEGERDGFE